MKRFRLALIGGLFYSVLADADSLGDFELPDSSAPGRFEHAGKEIPRPKDTYIVMAGWFELFDTAWYLRGSESSIKNMYQNRTFVNCLLDRIFIYDSECGPSRRCGCAHNTPR